MNENAWGGVWILPLLPMAAMSVGCTKSVTAQLEPIVVAQDCTSSGDESSAIYCNSISQMGLACNASTGVVAANSLKSFSYPFPSPYVGWGDAYDPGTQPLPCWSWVSTFSRGYVKFDLTKLVGPVASIDSAALTWKTTRVKGGPSDKACVKKLYEATGPWERGKTPTILLYDNLDATATKAGFFGVQAQANKWFANPNANFGFVFEPSRAKTVEKSNSDCLDSLENLRLVVKYSQKTVSWPGH